MINSVVPWVVSGPGWAAMRGQAERLAEWAAGPGREAGLADVGWSLVTDRPAFEDRAVVLGVGRAELAAGLRAVAADRPHRGAVTGTVMPGGTGPVLAFGGQGSQWAGMGAALLASFPVFAARIGECEAALAPYVDWSLAGVLAGDGAELPRVEVVQPALWAVMMSLAAVWESFGVVPAAVIGHSQGEIAAACVAGAISLADGARIVAVRAAALRALAGQGAMASLAVGEEQAAGLITAHGGGQVSVAAVNGPQSTVVSGPAGAVAAVVAAVEQAGARARLIDVDYASHGPQVDQVAGQLAAELAGISPVAGNAAFYSAVTGGRLDGAALDGGYWVRNLRQPVRFADAVGALLGDGHRVFIEASPHPVLGLALQETFDHAGVTAAAIPTMRRDRGDAARLARALGQAWCAGAPVDWRSWYAGAPACPPPGLPAYAF